MVFLQVVSKEIVLEIAQKLSQKEAKNILLLEMTNTPMPCDYFVIMNANSKVHMKALRQIILELIKEKDMFLINYDKGEEYDWMIVDSGEIVFHIFSEKGRKFYALEDLWIEAKKTPVE